LRFWQAYLLPPAMPGQKTSFLKTSLPQILLALAGVALTTIAITLIHQVIDIGRVGIIFLLPVLFAALRWGLVPALFASVASVGSSAFFFYAPVYSFEAHSYEHQVDLALFTIIAVVASELATRIRRQAEIERLREAMIGSVSHELRTPLASVMGALSVVSESSAVVNDPRLSALSKMAREELERLNDDIQNMLDASRISSQGIQAKSEGVDLADVINAALDRRERKLANHKLQVELPDEIPFTQGDPMLIEQAIVQALDNAAKYAPRSSTIRLKVGVQAGNIVLTIADQGPGIAEHEQRRVKERFFRGSGHTGTTAGSGLGLWIADAFIAACGGQLTVTSPGPGKGTTVTITLPASRYDPSDMEANADE
jgi:two-component system sensor histidine kinase KdpD